MTEPMLDKMAAELAFADLKELASPNELDGTAAEFWGVLADYVKEQYRANIRAVLSVLREPTEAMMLAMREPIASRDACGPSWGIVDDLSARCEEWPKWADPKDQTSNCMPAKGDTAVYCWRAGIDAIEQEGQQCPEVSHG